MYSIRTSNGSTKPEDGPRTLLFLTSLVTEMACDKGIHPVLQSAANND